MRFRFHQDEARRATQQLLILFVLLVGVLVLAVNGLLLLLWWLLFAWLAGLPMYFFATNTVLVLLFVIGGCGVELGRLRSGGGGHVARWAGGRALADARNPMERRLLNVVDELTLASGIVRPAVFMLEREDAINAFAAGWSAEDAIIAVTRGALERLTRDELQGLVAHEFGHIQQDDLRLNMVLLAMVWGLSLVYGYGRSLMEADDLGRRSPFGLLVGGVFAAAGSLGWLAGKLLQAAVSRHRELLADACAVQMTRSRDGLGGTLRKIWGQVLDHEAGLRYVPAHMLAAMLLQAPRSWVASHPPLSERLRRIYGRQVEPMAAPVLKEVSESKRSEPVKPLPMTLTPDFLAMTCADNPLQSSSTDSSGSERDAIDWLSRANGPGEIRATLLALMLIKNNQRELDVWREATRGLGNADTVFAAVAKLSRSSAVPFFGSLLERAAKLGLAARQGIVEAAHRVMSADGEMRPVACLQWLLLHHRLGDSPSVQLAPNSGQEMAALSHALLCDVARLSALLSRVVPEADSAKGDAWYRSLMGQWLTGDELPPAELPPVEDLLSAATNLRGMPWHLKPILIRSWMAVARNGARQRHLSEDAADALRLAALLLDCPMPEELERNYVNTP